jgi:hypothetical protein
MTPNRPVGQVEAGFGWRHLGPRGSVAYFGPGKSASSGLDCRAQLLFFSPMGFVLFLMFFVGLVGNLYRGIDGQFPERFHSGHCSQLSLLSGKSRNDLHQTGFVSIRKCHHIGIFQIHR